MADRATTPRHFAIFKAEVRRLVKLWRIVGWRIEFEHATIKDARGECRFDERSQVATIRLATEMDDPPTDAGIREIARHETIHVIVAPIHGAAENRYTTSAEVNACAERVVRHLQELLP